MTRHRSPRVLAVAAATALLAPPLLNAQAAPSHHVAVPPAAARPEDVATVDGIVRAYYDVITGPAGQPRQWARDRSLYIPDPRFVATRGAQKQPHPRVMDHQAFVDATDSGFVHEGFYEGGIHPGTPADRN